MIPLRFGRWGCGGVVELDSLALDRFSSVVHTVDVRSVVGSLPWPVVTGVCYFRRIFHHTLRGRVNEVVWVS